MLAIQERIVKTDHKKDATITEFLYSNFELIAESEEVTIEVEVSDKTTELGVFRGKLRDLFLKFEVFSEFNESPKIKVERVFGVLLNKGKPEEMKAQIRSETRTSTSPLRKSQKDYTVESDQKENISNNQLQSLGFTPLNLKENKFGTVSPY